MKNKVIKRVLALSLAACLVIPALSYVGSLPEAKAADTEWDAEVGDANGDGSINAIDLVILKKNAGESVAEQYDVNNDGNGDAKDANRMRQFLIGKTSSFYRPDTSAQNNDTATYQVTDDLDREMTDASASNGKAVGVRYFLHHGVGKNNMAELHFYHFNEGKVNVVTKEAYASGSTISFKAKLPENAGWWGFKFANTSSFDIYGVTDATLIEEIDGWRTYEIEVPSGGPYYFGISGAKNWSDWGDSPIIVDDFKITKPDGTVKEDGFDNGLSGGIFDVTEIGEGANGCTCDVHTAVELISETVDSSESAPVYNVSAILAKNPNAAISDSAWLAAGGGPVGAAHWWGEPLFGFYSSIDKWIIERDVQMLTDAGVDYLAIDTDDGILESRLNVLLETLDKFQDQGFNVPKVTFTTAVDSSVIETVNSYGLLYAESMDEVTATTLRLARAVSGYPMSASAFYGNLINQQRNYNGKKHITLSKTAEYEGAFLEWQFETAIENGAKNVLVESWNEWLSVRQAADSTGAIVLKENASISSSSDMQPMKDGYGDDYYMQFIDCIKRFKGNAITNSKLNTADTTESIAIDVNGDFQQWNKVSTHYLDYTNEEANPTENITTITKQEAEIQFGVDGTYIITKDKYPAGSTISFTIKFPEDLVQKKKSDGSDDGYPWWSVYAVTDKSKVDIYSSNGETIYGGLQSPSADNLGKEVTVSCPVHSTAGDYYIYIAGEWGQWKNASKEFVTAEISDITITSGDTTVSDGEIFETVGSGATLHSVTKVLTNEVIDYAADISMSNPQSYIITKETYKGGSKVYFDIKLPKDLDLSKNPWWGIYASTSNNVNIYANWVGKGRYITSEELGVWQTISVTLPTDSEEYYIYFAGEELKWKDVNGENVFTSIDNIVIEESDGSVTSENFNSGYGDIFAVGDSVSLTERSRKEVPLPGTNDIDKMKMTSDGEYLYALVETVDNIAAFGDESNRMSLFISTGNVGGCWNQYEYVINRDSTKATESTVTIERYAGGAWKQVTDADGNAVTAKYCIEGNMMQLAIPLSALGKGEAFDIEFKWADNYDDEDIYSFYTQGDAAPYGRANYVYQATGQHADITINKMGSDPGNMSFISSRTFPGGSTVNFDILIPENLSGSWWGMCWTTDPTTAGLYDWLEENGSKGKTLSSTTGSWANCSIELPDDDGDYYVYLVAAVGEWPKPETGAADTVFSIDNFVVEDGSGNVIAKDTFNGGSALFTMDENAVKLVSNFNEYGDQSAEIHIQYLNPNAGGWNFITKDAYLAGSKIVFDVYIPSGNSGSWCGAVTSTDPSSINIYACSEGNAFSMDTVNQWVTYEKQITEDGQYLAIGGPAGEWTDRNLFVDNFKVYDAEGKLIAKDDFSSGLNGGMFEVTGYEGNNLAVSLGTPSMGVTSTTSQNMVSLSTTGDDCVFMVSSNAYPAGSTITFDAKFPTTTSWWGVAYTSDKDSADRYSDSKITPSIYTGEWSTYSVTLPSDGGPYYFHFSTAIGEWGGENILLDNVKVQNASGKLLAEDDFNYNDFDEGMFDCLYAASATLVAEEEDTVVDVEFMAYDAPTVNGSVSGDNTAKVDAAYKKMAEAGFNKALAQREGYSEVAAAMAAAGSDLATWLAWRRTKTEEAAGTVLDIADKYGISYYAKDWSFYNLGRASGDAAVVTSSYVSTDAQWNTAMDTLFNSDVSYLTHSALAGHFAMDEPSTDADFTALANQAKYYSENVSDGEMFVNLLPSYGKPDDRNIFEQWLGTELPYKSYLNKYFTIAQQYGMDYVSWDYYPFMLDSDSDKTTRENEYLYNYELVANYIKDNNYTQEIRTLIQATGEEAYGLRSISSIADIRHQIYCGMAFGAKEFGYYCYSGTNDAVQNGNCIFSYEDGESYTDVYNFAKTVNNEVHAIEDFYGQYSWETVACKSGKTTTTMSQNMINGLETSYKSGTYKHMTINSCSQDTLAGIFTATNTAATTRPYGYMFVNIADPDNNAEDEVTVTFNNGSSNAKAVSVCQGGEQKIVSISDGQYKFTLTAGEGAFIVPIY